LEDIVEAPDTVERMPQHQGLRRFSDIYIPLRKLSLTPRILLQSGILRSLKNFGEASCFSSTLNQ
jgi:hypothetical protein